MKSDRGPWVRLNTTPVPYLDPEANGSTLGISVGSYKHGTEDNNVLDMDNLRVRQLTRGDSARAGLK